MAMAGMQARLAVLEEQRGLAVLIVFLGFMLFIAGAFSMYEKPFPEKLQLRFQNFTRLAGITPTQFVYLLLALIFSLTACLAAGTDDEMMLDLPLAVICWLASILFVVIAVWQANEALPLTDKRTWVTAGALFLVSAAVRVIAAGSIPPLLNGDEASSGLSAVAFANGSADNIFGVGWFSFPSLYYFLQSLSIRAFGQTTFALRFSSALVGALTVVLVYCIGKRMFSERAGLAAAIILTGSHFHNHFSRLGLNNIWDGFWFTLVLGTLWYGWVSQKRSAFLLAGLGLGLSQYFYTTSRFLIVLVPAWLLLAWLLNRKDWAGNRANSVYLLLVALVCALPSIWFFSHDAEFYHLTAPFNRVTALGDWLDYEVILQEKPGWQIMLDQLATSAKTFVSSPLDVWYAPEQPILRVPAAVLFLAGLILLLFQMRKPVAWLLFAWVAAFVFIGGFSVPVSAAQRYVAVMPACALVIGFGVDEVARLVSKVWQRRAGLLGVVALALVMLISLDDLNFYYFDYTPNTQLGGDNTLVAQRLADYLQDKSDLQVAFFGVPRMGYYSITSTAYLAPNIQGLDFNEPWGAPDNPVIENKHVVFVFLPEQQENLKRVKQDYPFGTVIVEPGYNDEALYWLYDTYKPTSP